MSMFKRLSITSQSLGFYDHDDMRSALLNLLELHIRDHPGSYCKVTSGGKLLIVVYVVEQEGIKYFKFLNSVRGQHFTVLVPLEKLLKAPEHDLLDVPEMHYA